MKRPHRAEVRFSRFSRYSRFSRLVRLTAPLLIAAWLAGCATPPREAGGAPWTSGRLSVRVDATELKPAQSLSAAFDLRGDGTRGELRLNSPLGSQLAAARWSSGLAELETSQGVSRFDSLDELSRQALGEALPLAALPDWLAGRPWPGAPHEAAEGGFTQLGWQVQQARRGEGIVEARRIAPPVVLVRVRLEEPS